MLAEAYLKGVKDAKDADDFKLAIKYYKKMLFLAWTLSTRLCN